MAALSLTNTLAQTLALDATNGLLLPELSSTGASTPTLIKRDLVSTILRGVEDIYLARYLSGMSQILHSSSPVYSNPSLLASHDSIYNHTIFSSFLAVALTWLLWDVSTTHSLSLQLNKRRSTTIILLKTWSICIVVVFVGFDCLAL